MGIPTHSEAFQVLLMQAAADGRGDILFGECAQRVREAVPPFLVSQWFPSIFLEFPLFGDPFLDVTILYNKLAPHTRIASPAAQGTERMLDWFAEASSHHDNISCGFELDTKEGDIPAAAIHFQPRAKRELVRPFMESIDASERAHLYLDTDDRLPQGWALSFLGLFRGRPASPLRVCGYFHKDVQERCKGNPQALAEVFRRVDFHAYDDIMLRQATKLIGLAPAQLDFQLDVLPDGSMSDTFALDVSFNMERSDRVIESFAHGDASRIMGCFRDFGVTDERADIVADASITRMLPMVADDGSLVRFAFTLMPLWIKARWVAGELVPAKLYYQAVARPV